MKPQFVRAWICLGLRARQKARSLDSSSSRGRDMDEQSLICSENASFLLHSLSENEPSLGNIKEKPCAVSTRQSFTTAFTQSAGEPKTGGKAVGTHTHHLKDSKPSL